MTPATILLLAGLAVLVLAGRQLGFGNRPLPVVLRPLVDTGTVFILLGAVLGPFGFNVFTGDLLSQLSPVIVIGLGWIGFLYGSHWEWRLLRRYSLALYGAATLQALVAFVVIFGLSWLLLSVLVSEIVSPTERLAAALILGICGMSTAPAGVFHLTGRHRIAPDDLNSLRFLATVDDLPALFLLGLMTAFLHPPLPDGTVIAPWIWLAASIALGLGLGFITHWLFPVRDDLRQNTLVLLGIVSLGAGTAVMLRLSPLFVTALAGVAFANLSPRKERAYGLLANSEHSLYTVFLLVGGLLFRFDWGTLVALVPVYLLLRGAGKIAGGYLAKMLLLRRTGVSPLIGAGMLFQGGMALAMAISFQRTHLAELDSQVTTTIVLGVVVFELVGPWIAQGILGKGKRG